MSATKIDLSYQSKDQSLTTSKIRDRAITAIKIALESIANEHIASNAEIDISKIKNLQSQLDSKLNLTGGTITGTLAINGSLVYNSVSVNKFVNLIPETFQIGQPVNSIPLSYVAESVLMVFLNGLLLRTDSYYLNDTKTGINFNDTLQVGDVVIVVYSTADMNSANGIMIGHVGSGINFPSSGNYSGITVSGNVSYEALNYLDLVYLDPTTKKWRKASCTSINTIAQGICMTPVSGADNPVTVLKLGIINLSTPLSFSDSLLYLSSTGTLTNVAPTTSGYQVQVVGKLTGNNIIDFNPSYVTAEVK